MNTSGTVKPSALRATDTITRVGLLGLGIMGSAIAGNLVKAGFEVYGFDPLAQARRKLKACGGRPCPDAATLVRGVQVLITSLPSAAALAESAGIIAAHGQRGLRVIEASTLDIRDKEAARQTMAGKGVVLLDCPLSGTGAQAVHKDLTVYASGARADIRRMKPVFDGFAHVHADLGRFGNGMKMKLMANLLVAIHNVSTAEALLLGQRWGIAPASAVKVLAGGAGGSRMLQVRGPMMQDAGWENATMKVRVWQKDMQLIAQALADTGTPAPLFAATVPLYNAAIGLGHEDHDTAAVFDVLQQMSTPPLARRATGRSPRQRQTR